MHERAAVSRSIEALMALSGGEVAVVEAVIGPSVDPEVVRLVWDQAVHGTPAEFAELRWSRTADTLRCFDCGADFEGGKLDPCPACGGSGLVVRPAPEFAIVGWTGAR